MLNDFTWNMTGYIPVSYTHLDVYKRQTHYNTFIHSGCQVPWALPRGCAVTAVTSADPGKMSATFPMVSPSA